MASQVQQKDLSTSFQRQLELFSDFFTGFDKHPTKNDLLRATNEAAVKQSIRNLLLTNRGEHFFDGQIIGSDLQKQLFENAGPATEGIIADFITNTITNFEPRAKLLKVDVNVDPETRVLVATIIFSLINKQEPITLELILNRVR